MRVRLSILALLLDFDGRAVAVTTRSKSNRLVEPHALSALGDSPSSGKQKSVTWHQDMDNIEGPHFLQRLPGLHMTQTGIVPQNGPAAEDLGATKNASACLDACMSKFPDTCYSITFYNGYGTTPAGCFAVTTSYYDWFPAHDPLHGKQVTSARVWHGCLSDNDCASNGICQDGGSCKCDSGWTGSACSQLDLQPTLSNDDAGYKLTSEKGRKISSWGGAVHKDEYGVYHMWVSHMRKHCGILAWTTNSAILHATSSNRLGPYVPAVNDSIRKSIVFPTFSHEPDVKRGPNGEWIMFMTSYEPKKGEEACVCTNGTTPSTCPSTAADYTPQTTMSWSMSPWGPWSKPVIVISNVGVDLNFSPIIRPDGSLMALARKFEKDDLGMGWGISKVITATARNWKDPSTYTLHPKRDLFEGSALRGATEDPWLYEAPDGQLHALFHNMYGCFACCGHAFAEKVSESNDTETAFPALKWTYTGADACLPFVEEQDGSTLLLGRRERPHMLFDSQKRPLMLTNGVTVCPQGSTYCPTPYDSDRSWTLTQPIRVKD